MLCITGLSIRIISSDGDNEQDCGVYFFMSGFKASLSDPAPFLSRQRSPTADGSAPATALGTLQNRCEGEVPRLACSLSATAGYCQRPDVECPPDEAGPPPATAVMTRVGVLVP